MFGLLMRVLRTASPSPRRRARSAGPRDSQRGRVYRWEGEHVMPQDRALLSLGSCQRLVDEVYRWAEADVSHQPGWAPPEVTDGRGRRHACGSRQTIKLPRWARTRPVVLHECAHGLADDKHGPRFVARYVELLERFMASIARVALVAGPAWNPDRHRRGVAQVSAASASAKASKGNSTHSCRLRTALTGSKIARSDHGASPPRSSQRLTSAASSVEPFPADTCAARRDAAAWVSRQPRVLCARSRRSGRHAGSRSSVTRSPQSGLSHVSADVGMRPGGRPRVCGPGLRHDGIVVEGVVHPSFRRTAPRPFERGHRRRPRRCRGQGWRGRWRRCRSGPSAAGRNGGRRAARPRAAVEQLADVMGMDVLDLERRRRPSRPCGPLGRTPGTPRQGREAIQHPPGQSQLLAARPSQS